MRGQVHKMARRQMELEKPSVELGEFSGLENELYITCRISPCSKFVQRGTGWEIGWIGCKWWGRKAREPAAETREVGAMATKNELSNISS